MRRTVSGRTQALVIEKLRALQANLGAGTTPTANKLTVDQFLEHWLNDVLPGSVSSVNTIDNYTWAIRNHISPALGHRPLLKLAPPEVGEFLRHKLDSGLARNSVMRIRSVLSAALDQAVLEGLVTRNVAALIRMPRRGARPEGRALTADQALALLAAARGRRLEAAYITMLMVGLRPGEILGLQWPDLDPDNRTLRIDRSLKRERGQLILGDTKTRRSRRVVGLPTPVLGALTAHRRRQAKERLALGPAWAEGDLIFPTNVGTPLDPANFRREFSAICHAAGLGHWHPHELRHSAVSLLSAAGVPLEAVADVMGHHTTRTTEAVYRHRVLPAATGAVQAMDDLFGDR
ncbi:MAG: tyrosine-type recombinase/integrase [Acidimicrobiia bacterium]